SAPYVRAAADADRAPGLHQAGGLEVALDHQRAGEDDRLGAEVVDRADLARRPEVLERPAGVVDAAVRDKRIEKLLVVAAAFEMAKEPAKAGGARAFQS